ncbi:hypothetical protein CRUP_018043 [Coryphaenoides rupestris]|nr:hypothetical protein CRUP_018043 [Coryphaenoides rupestris]
MLCSSAAPQGPPKATAAAPGPTAASRACSSFSSRASSRRSTCSFSLRSMSSRRRSIASNLTASPQLGHLTAHALQHGQEVSGSGAHIESTTSTWPRGLAVQEVGHHLCKLGATARPMRRELRLTRARCSGRTELDLPRNYWLEARGGARMSN